VDNERKLDNRIIARLRSHLPATLQERLFSTDALSAEALELACVHLRAKLAAIATYIPSPIVGEQIARPRFAQIGGAYWNGSVLFADLSGFTAMSEQFSALGKQGAEEISAIINNLFGALVEEIHRYHGTLLKFGGDALTAFFSEDELGRSHALLASRAALALQERMADFTALQTRVGTFALRLRIGVHSGRVFAAQVGDAQHIELVITGRNINRVALAQDIAEPGDVVVTRATLALLQQGTNDERRTTNDGRPGDKETRRPGDKETERQGDRETRKPEVEERQSGFYRLLQTPEVALPTGAGDHTIAPGAGDLAELLTLVEQIDALHIYLPRGLPNRFLEESARGGETGEFRPVTVLFANFFPFSSALDILGDDSAAAAQALNAYYSRAQLAIHRYGGIINKVDMYAHGDKLMALFGAPVANEDDPQRAVRAAFELQALLDEANREIAALLRPAAANLIAFDEQFLKQRIGINTGVVFAGQVGSTTRREYTVMGQPVNLAARLMAVSEPGAITLSPSTRRAVERAIAVRELPPVRLKGVTEPVPLAVAVEGAGPSTRSLARPALVGRGDELAQLLDEAHTALNGSGRAIALVGEPGAGKTRLIEETLHEMVLRSGTRNEEMPSFFPYSVECQSYEQNTPYAALRELLRQFFNLLALDAPGTRNHESITQRVRELAPEMERFTPLLADLTGMPIEDTPLTAALTPEQRHDRALELVEALLLAEAQQEPLVLILDDLHWADASSLEFITRLTRVAVRAPILMLLGYRTDPQIAEPWADWPHCARLVIGELSQEGSAALVRELLHGEPPPALGGLLEKTQGNPFFIEEVVRGLVESGALQLTDDGWQLTRDADQIAVPDSIEGVITARLDRLEEHSREVLQTASVIGRRFPYAVLSGIVLRDNDLIDRLLLLTEADLILPEGDERDTGALVTTTAPAVTGTAPASLLAYLFKHALTRDVAYEAILYARRRDLHRRVAHRIELIYADQIDEHLPLLARHYLLAEEWAPAFDYHLRAARQAQARYANREAIALLERALEIGLKIGERMLVLSAVEGSEVAPMASQSLISNLQSHLVETQERLGVIHALIGEYDAALTHYQAALERQRGQPDAPLDGLVRLHHHIARVYEKRADFEQAFAWVERGLALAGNAQSVELVRCLLLGAGLHQRQGRYTQALEWAERALLTAQNLHSVREQAAAYKLLGSTNLNLGDTVRALELILRSLQLYEQIQDLDGLSYAHNDVANIYYELGRLTEARRHYEAGTEIKRAMGDIYGQALIANNLGDLLKLQDHIDEAVAQYQQSLSIFEQVGSVYASGVLHMNLGAVQLLRNQLDIAETHLRQSTELFNQAGAEDFLPELERYIADLHMRRGHFAEARFACELSLATAARLEARTEEGITRRSLGQIIAQSGDTASAWDEFEQSLATLREVDNPHEVAKTLVALAALAPSLGRYEHGQTSLNEALPILSAVGAQRDLKEAYAIATRYGYTIADNLGNEQPVE
jgi:class 3 adenylate cyclase/tetratricopeptide (TPR) repeat protein